VIGKVIDWGCRVAGIDGSVTPLLLVGYIYQDMVYALAENATGDIVFCTWAC